MKLRFIINPISGKAKHLDIADLIETQLDPAKHQFDYFFTEGPKQATELAKQAVKEKIDVVIAVGGDGTLNECANGVVGSKTALGVIPCGSGNGFAFHFKMNKQIAKAIEQLNTCSIKTIDSCTANGHPFFNVSGTGFDAHIAHLFSTLQIRGFLNYVKLVLKECILFKSRKYNIEIDGKELEFDAFMVSWANASQFGNNATISPLGKEDDGQFEICVLKKLPKILIPVMLYKLFTNSIHHSKYMEIISCKEAVVHCQNGQSHLDGEPIDLGQKINLNLLPKSIHIFAPHV
jgi:diacylglycerol kinase (ATP)